MQVEEKEEVQSNEKLLYLFIYMWEESVTFVSATINMH